MVYYRDIDMFMLARVAGNATSESYPIELLRNACSTKKKRHAIDEMCHLHWQTARNFFLCQSQINIRPISRHKAVLFLLLGISHPFQGFPTFRKGWERLFVWLRPSRKLETSLLFHHWMKSPSFFEWVLPILAKLCRSSVTMQFRTGTSWHEEGQSRESKLFNKVSWEDPLNSHNLTLRIFFPSVFYFRQKFGESNDFPPMDKRH